MTHRARCAIPVAFYRGGTSKALIFHHDDLPPCAAPGDFSAWTPVFLGAMGSPDPSGRQLNGMGGGLSSLSKVAVIRKSDRADADIDYTFGQVMVDKAEVGYRGNCGNISSAVGPFAVAEGLIPVTGDSAEIRIFNTNTQKIIVSRFAVGGGQPVEHGDFTIDGVSGSGAPIRLSFMYPGGASTGQLLPTGNARDELALSGGRTITASLVDAANPVVFVTGADVGMSDYNPTDGRANSPDMLALFEDIRVAAAVAMGMADEPTARQTLLNLPLVGIVYPPAPYATLSGRRMTAADGDICVQFISAGQPHKASPITGGLCMAVANRIAGSVVQDVARPPRPGSDDFCIANPSGSLTVSASVAMEDGEPRALEAAVLRTARRLMDGRVYYD